MRTAKTLIRLGGCQADLSLRWAHTHFVGSDMRRLRCHAFSKCDNLAEKPFYYRPVQSKCSFGCEAQHSFGSVRPVVRKPLRKMGFFDNISMI